MEDIESKIQKIADIHFESDISGLEELSGGASHYTYSVNLENREEYVFKLSNYDWSALPDYEHGFPIDGPVLRFLSDIEGIPTPEAFFFDNSEEDFDFKYVISEKIEGKNLYEVQESQDLSVFREAGKNLAMIHEQVNFKSPGKLVYHEESVDICVQNRKEWREMFSDIINSLIDNLEDTSFSELIPEIKGLFEDNKEVLRDNPPNVLVHQEFSPRNLIVKDGEINGILDWERSISGDPEYDLFTAERHFTVKQNLFEDSSRSEEEVQKAFTEGYREVRPLEEDWGKRRNLYHLAYMVHVLWILDGEVERDNLIRKYEELKEDLGEM